MKYIAHEKSFPAYTGLTIHQIYEAIRSAGYLPHWVGAKNISFFKTLLKINLDSGFPVILIINIGNAYHAVCVAGYKSNQKIIPYFTHDGPKLTFYTWDFDKIYIHDDRLGPYARATFKLGTKGEIKLLIQTSAGTEDWNVNYFISPLYEKIRSYDSDQNEKAVRFTGYLHNELLKNNLVTQDEFLTQTIFIKGGDVLYHVSKTDHVRPEVKIKFLKKIQLSRYVGFSTVLTKDGIPLFTLLYDSTDFYKGDILEGLLGIICYQDYLRNFLSPLEKINKVAII
ncbi:hypothetical protein ACFL5V_10625 [Fibrobacterota bacterium]